jgi:putative phosphoribosyl transferase
MYFASRTQAGRMLANQIAPKYHGQPCAVVALSDGGVVVGAQIAGALRCVLSMLLTEEIRLPREPEAVAGITQDGSVSYNAAYSPGELDELIGEYYQYLEQEKLTRIGSMNHAAGNGSTIDKRLLEGQNVIVVSDGLASGFSFDAAVTFLKPVAIKRLIVAVPLASVKAVDRLHIAADEIFCLSVVEDYISTDHYYDQHDVPPHEKVVEIIEHIMSNWQ